MGDKLVPMDCCEQKITMRFNLKWQVILAHMPSFAILGLMLATISVTEARTIFTTTDRINERIKDAVNKERDQYEKKIKILNEDLSKAQETSQKLIAEKSAYEQKVKTDLEKLSNEKNKAISELNKTKSEFENAKKNLNTSIENLKNEIETKTKEQDNLNKKLKETEKAQKDFEDKAKNELDKTIKQYNSKIKALNKTIFQKSSQLKAQTNQLKNLNLSFEVQSASLYSSEAKTYSDIEIFKGTIRMLQSELRALIEQAKSLDIKRIQYIKVIQNQVAVEKQNFAEQIKAIQEADVQNLLRIEKLNNLIQRLISKNQKLEKAGKILETKLMAKIQALKKHQKQSEQQYKSLAKAYAKAETQNLVAIDQLKQELKNAMIKNRSLIELANKINKEKRDEDIADAKMETNLLLKIENLKNELNIAIQKNENLAQNVATTKKYIDKLKKAESDNSAKLQKAIQSLTTEIKTMDNRYKDLLQKYNDHKNLGINNIKQITNTIPSTLSTGQYSQVNQPNYTKNLTSSTVYSSSSPYANVQHIEVLPTRPRDYQFPVMKRSNIRGHWVIEKLNRKFPFLRMKVYEPVASMHPRNLAQSKYVQNQDAPAGIFPQSTPRLEQTANTPSSKKDSNLKSQTKTQLATEASDDELVKFALDTTLKAVAKMANYDEDKINASLKLIGAEAEMPKKLSAIVDVIKDKYNPTIYQKVVQEIAKMCKRGTVK